MIRLSRKTKLSKGFSQGFSLLEVVIAVVILAGGMLAVSRITSASYTYSSKVDNIYLGTELAWLKLSEIELDIEKNGIPDGGKEEEGEFEDESYKGIKWKYSIKMVRFSMPEMSSGDESGNQDVEQAKSAMGFIEGPIEDFIRENIRKLTLKVYWGDGDRESEKVVFTKFLGNDYKEAPKGK